MKADRSTKVGTDCDDSCHITMHVLLSLTLSPPAARAAIPAPISLPRAAVLRLSSDAASNVQTVDVYSTDNEHFLVKLVNVGDDTSCKITTSIVGMRTSNQF